MQCLTLISKDENNNVYINLRKHRLKLHQTNDEYQQAKQTCQNHFGKGGFKLLHHMINNDLRKERNQSLRTKNMKIFKLTGKRKAKRKQHEEPTVPIFNLSDKRFPKSVTNCLRFGLNHSFVDKNRFIKVSLATELESFHQQVKNQVRKTSNTSCATPQILSPKMSTKQATTHGKLSVILLRTQAWLSYPAIKIHQ